MEQKGRIIHTLIWMSDKLKEKINMKYLRVLNNYVRAASLAIIQ